MGSKRVPMALFLYGLVAASVAIWVSRVLFMDGSATFLDLIETRAFHHKLESRLFSYFFFESPLLLALGLFKIRDLEILSRIYAAPVFLSGLVSLWISARIAGKENRRWLLFPFVSYFLVQMDIMLQAMNELTIALAFFWPLLFWLTFREHKSTLGKVLSVLAAFAAMFSYETFIVFIPLFIRLANRQFKLHVRLQTYYQILLFVLMIGFIHLSNWIIWPHNPKNRTAQWDALTHLRLSVPLVAMLLAASITFLSFYGKRTWHLWIVLLGFLTYQLRNSWLPFWPMDQYGDRIFIPFFFLAIAVIFLQSLHQERKAASPFHFNKAWIILGFFAMLTTTYDLMWSRYWVDYKKTFQSELAKRTGSIAFEQTVFNGPASPSHMENRMGWIWTMPYLSIIWSQKINEQILVKSMIQNHPDAIRVRIIPQNPTTYPDLSDFNVKYVLRGTN